MAANCIDFIDCRHSIVNKQVTRIEVGETKNDEARTIYLDDELKEIFNHQWEIRKTIKKLIPFLTKGIGYAT